MDEDKKMPELNQVICGDCLEVMKGWPDNCVDSICCDPPYGLSAAKNSGKTSTGGFMGQKWDYDVPSVEIWAECLRVLKPGGYLLAFAGTRTQHRMACRIEDAGFEIRDMIAWVYGCLSDDTEIMIDGHWGSYRDAIKGKKALGYNCKRNVLEWQEIEDLFVIEGYCDKAFSIKSEGTDQIVSLNHRCLVKDGDGYSFKRAEDLEYRVTVPIVDADGNVVDCDACVEQMHYSGVVWCVKVPTGAFVARRKGKIFITGNSGFPKSLNIGKKIDQLMGAERKVVGKDKSGSERNCMAGDFVGGEYDITKGTSKYEGYGTALKPAWECITCAIKPEKPQILTDILSESIELCKQLVLNVEKNLKHTQAESNVGKTNIVQTPVQTPTKVDQKNKTAIGEAVDINSTAGILGLTPEMGHTALNMILSWKNTLVGVYNAMKMSTTSTVFETIIDWKTLNYCLSVITPNDIIKVQSNQDGSSANVLHAATYLHASLACLQNTLTLSVLAPAMSSEAVQYQEKVVKPSLEPIIMSRKPLSEKTIVENVLKYGTGGLNIDGCRVGYINDADKASATPQGQCTAKSGALAGGTQNDGERAVFERPDQNGRWPANFIHDGSEEVEKLFPETTSGSGNKHPSNSKRYIGNSLEHSSTMGDDKCFDGSTGSAARFFYSAKASKSDRDDGCHAMNPKRSGYRPNEPEDGYNGNSLSARLHDSVVSKNNHPCVKPQNLMQYLCRLVTPSDGIVLDPFAGSGSTCKAAIAEGFKFIGIEINPDYIDISYNRIEQEKSYGVQTDLFGS